MLPTKRTIEFQPRKCENLRISRKRISFSRVYRINHNAELKCVDSQKDLGVIVTGNLLWNSHIVSISAKANRILGFLKRNCSKEISSNALKVLYLALVRSHLGYCSQIWAPQSVIRNILLVESVQRIELQSLSVSYPKRITIVIGIVLSTLIYYHLVIG